MLCSVRPSRFRVRGKKDGAARPEGRCAAFRYFAFRRLASGAPGRLPFALAQAYACGNPGRRRPHRLRLAVLAGWVVSSATPARRRRPLCKGRYPSARPGKIVTGKPARHIYIALVGLLFHQHRRTTSAVVADRLARPVRTVAEHHAQEPRRVRLGQLGRLVHIPQDAGGVREQRVYLQLPCRLGDTALL